MTTVGFGDITAQNPKEVGFVTFLLIVAAVIFPLILSVVNDLFVAISADSRFMTDRTQALARYMQWRKVPQSLFFNVREHLVFEWDSKKGYAEYEDTVMEQLPPILKQELCYHIYGNLLRRTPFLKWMSDVDVCMKELSLLVSTVVRARGDIVCRRGATNETIYILMSGTVRMSTNLKLDEFALTIDYENDEESDEEPKPLSAASKFAAASFATQSHRKKSLREAISMNSEPILTVAEQNFNAQAKEEHLAAASIGRFWRLIMARRNRQCGHTSSRTVSAPSYFGESCLWETFDTWDSPNHPPHISLYNICCITRAELVTITRSSVKHVIDTHSPWLRNRFEFFRATVVKGHRHLQQPK
jgi:hypothetical protein